MIRIRLRGNPPRTVDIGADGGTLRCDVGPSGALAITVMRPVKKMTPQGMMEGVETTPVKIYAADQWNEVEYIEEPGDGLTVLPSQVSSSA